MSDFDKLNKEDNMPGARSFLKSRRCLPAVMVIAGFMSWCVPRLSHATATDTGMTFDNLRYKLSKDKKVTIAYLGGSITQGQGASNRAVTSWRPLTTTWFKTNYPQATVTEIDASWGATGSDLGAFRCTRDVSSKKPDLVFVEFAVNDWQKTDAAIKPYMDGIVRNVLRTLPNCVVVFVYAVHNNTIAPYDKGTAPPAVLAQQAVADHYTLCTINMGKVMWQAIAAGKGTLDTYTADGTHPTDAGYKIYADEIAGVLKRHLLTPAIPDSYTPAVLPEPLVATTVDNGVIYMADKLSFAGWTTTAVNEVRFPYQLSCNKPGTKLAYTFKGTAIGMYWVPNTDGGQMQWSIDNSSPVKMSAYAATSRGIFPVLTNKLGAGPHTLTIEVLSTKDAGSTGNYIRMGALFVDEDLEATVGNHRTRPQENNHRFSLLVESPFTGRCPASCILSTTVPDFFSVSRVGLSGICGTCVYKGKLGPGLHRISLETAGPAAGTYFYCVNSLHHGRTVRKIISVK